jgi:AcrR family transcriptional regulator
MDGRKMMENRKQYRRAMREEQKEERRQDIVEMAWSLFQQTSYEALTMADVAEALKLAKGTIYLYFKTKEELFLAIEEQQLQAAFAEIDERLKEIGSSAIIPQVVEVFCQALQRRPGLVRLLAILHSILEHNIDLAAAIHFKYLLKTRFLQTGSLLEACLPFLQPGGGAHLLLQIHALVIGLWSIADPAPVVQEALQRPDLTIFAVEFAPEFSQALQALLSGLERLTQPPPHSI